ncbi:class I SAM-dependent methyltransferase [Methanoregula sp.]|uniref:class I SAM-dependent methyltransferase n=1 Tax=Methanoregula sp. TaxID=2052170 RepID=UPI003566BB78
MTEHTNLYPVSDTAALVMLWAQEYYETKPVIGTYLSRLDLSRGRPLVERYNSICPWYPEVIINRKHFIKNTVEELMRNDAKRTIIVNLGAGFSPLALELSPLLCDRVRFIEIDMSNMSHKHELYSELVPDRCGFISCIEADISDTAFLTETLRKEMGDPARTRLIVVMEGLTYYIGKPAMERVLECLSHLAPDLAIIFEHLKPCRLVSEDRRFIPYGIFSHVRDYTSLDRMTTYSEDEIRAMLGPGFSCNYCDMDTMETERTGSRRYFPAPDSGWLSCAVAVRRPVTR